jgi:Asp/Glu/hydantoin racemase
MSNITMLAPFLDNSPLTQFARNEFAHLEDLRVVGTDSGSEIVTEYHHIEYNIGPMLEKAKEINRAGACDVMIVGCFGDPGLAAVRQVASMPVLGTGETALAVASLLGDKIGVIVPQMDMVRVTERMIHSYQFSNRVTRVRSAQELVPQTILTKPEESIKKMAETCFEVIRSDDSDVVIFGCIGFSWMVRQIRTIMVEQGLQIPLVEPGITVYQAAKMILELGLNQDRSKFSMLPG